MLKKLINYVMHIISGDWLDDVNSWGEEDGSFKIRDDWFT